MIFVVPVFNILYNNSKTVYKDWTKNGHNAEVQADVEKNLEKVNEDETKNLINK